MNKPSEVIVLAEDRRQQNFARGFLKSWGYKNRKVRFLDLPAGRGAGAQYVRERFPDELRALRKKLNMTAKALVVLIDADQRTTLEIRQALNAQLDSTDTDPIQTDEPVCLFIPKRNVETWVVCLLDGQANETDDYKPVVEDGQPQESGVRFGRAVRNGQAPQPNWVQSLKDAVPEAQLIPRA